MKKTIAVLVCDRSSEALRMSLGLTLVNDIIDVYIFNDKIFITKQDKLNIELMNELDMKVYANFKNDSNMHYLSIEKISTKLLEYDHVLIY